jgi:hypothetical protein
VGAWVTRDLLRLRSFVVDLAFQPRGAPPAAELDALRAELRALAGELAALRRDVAAAAGAAAAAPPPPARPAGPDAGWPAEAPDPRGTAPKAASEGAEAAELLALALAPARPAEAGAPEDSPAARARYEAAHARDEGRFSAAERETIDALYRDGTRQPGTGEGRALLAELVERFPEANRAGCAALNLASGYAADGDAPAAFGYLDPLVDEAHPGVFRNGVRVLPAALELRGRLHAEAGDAARARADWTRLVEEFADEADARGRSFGRVAAAHLARLAGTEP